MKLSITVKEELQALTNDCTEFIRKTLDEIPEITISEGTLTCVNSEIIVGLVKSDDYYLITEDEFNDRSKSKIKDLNIEDLLWVVEYLEKTLPSHSGN